MDYKTSEHDPYIYPLVPSFHFNKVCMNKKALLRTKPTLNGNANITVAGKTSVTFVAQANYSTFSWKCKRSSQKISFLLAGRFELG